MDSSFRTLEEALARLKADALATEQAGERGERRVRELEAELVEERDRHTTIRKGLEGEIQTAEATKALLSQEHGLKLDALSAEITLLRSDLNEAKETVRVQEDARRVSADEVVISNANNARLRALCKKQAQANQALAQDLSDLGPANPAAIKAQAEEIAALKAAKAEAEAKQAAAEAKQAAAEEALNTLKADLVGRELLVAEEQQAQAQPASKKKKKQKKVAASEDVVEVVQKTSPVEESVGAFKLMEKGVEQSDDVRLLKQEVKQLKAALEAANLTAHQCNVRHDADAVTASRKFAKLQKKYQDLTGKTDLSKLRDSEASAVEAEKKSKEQEEALDEAIKQAANSAEQLAHLQQQLLQLDEDRKDALQWQIIRAPVLHEAARKAEKAEEKAIARIAQLEQENAALRKSQPVNLASFGGMPGNFLMASLPRSGDPSSPLVGSPGTPGVPHPPPMNTMVEGAAGNSGFSSGGMKATDQPPPGTLTGHGAGGLTGHGAQQGDGRVVVLPRGPTPSQAVPARTASSHKGPGGPAARGSARQGGPQGGGRVLELPRGAPVRQAQVVREGSVPHPHIRGANNRREGTPAQGRQHGERQSGRHPTASANPSSR